MKNLIYLTLAATLSVLGLAPINSEESVNKRGWQDLDWEFYVREKYHLTDDEIKTLQEADIHGPEMAIAAEMYFSSGKPLGLIIEMRQGKRMKWIEVAKQLHVSPSLIGHSVTNFQKNDWRGSNSRLKQ